MLLIDRHDAERNLASANAELIMANEMVALQYLSSLDRSNISVQVKSKIIELLPSGEIREEEVAEALNVSLRTLQRKLREEGESYAHIVKVVKKEMAENYIQDSQLSINEIAYLLGFSDQANFTRAFRRWNGNTPSQYRLNLRKQSAMGD
jgi:AraC-like DNA-binding protein